MWQGASRNFENWRSDKATDVDVLEAEAELEEQNPMAVRPTPRLLVYPRLRSNIRLCLTLPYHRMLPSYSHPIACTSNTLLTPPSLVLRCCAAPHMMLNPRERRRIPTDSLNSHAVCRPRVIE